jgi:hypothetical protein
MTTVTKILLTYDIAYAIVFFYGTQICNKFYNGDVDDFFEFAPRPFIIIISFGMLAVLFQFIYFPLLVVWTGHF